MKKNKKKLKRIITNVMLYTICYRNVDKHDDIWVYAKYDLLGGKTMSLLKDIILWWFIIYSLLVVTIKPIRKNHIDFLKRIDN